MESEMGLSWEKAAFLSRLVSVAVKASQRAGLEIKRICAEGELRIVDKGANDLQTAADRTAQWTIVNSLRAKFGTHLLIIGEEDLDESKAEKKAGFIESEIEEAVLTHDTSLPDKLRLLKSDEVPSTLRNATDMAVDDRDVNLKLVVWIDPLDGTKEFTQAAKSQDATALEQVTVLVGIGWKRSGEALAGVIHQPFYGTADEPALRLGRTVWAVRGAGAHGITPRPVHKEPLVVTTKSHGTKSVEAALNALRDKGLLSQVLRCGGAGYKVLRMLDGGAAAYIFPSPGTKKWDTCAPEAILAELGSNTTPAIQTRGSRGVARSPLHSVGVQHYFAGEMHGGALTDIHGASLDYSGSAPAPNSTGVVATAAGINHSDYIAAIPPSLL